MGLGVLGGVLLPLVVPLLPFLPAGVLTTAELPHPQSSKVLHRHLIGCGGACASGGADLPQSSSLA